MLSTIFKVLLNKKNNIICRLRHFATFFILPLLGERTNAIGVIVENVAAESKTESSTSALDERHSTRKTRHHLQRFYLKPTDTKIFLDRLLSKTM